MVICTLITHLALSQTKSIKINQVNGSEKDVFIEIEHQFNAPNLRLKDYVFSEQKDYIFFTYQKLDTLYFDHPFFKNEREEDRTYEGLALYYLGKNGYDLQFANDEAFMCTSCNNRTDNGITLNNDTATLSTRWGPSFSNAYDVFKFAKVRGSKDWVLFETFASLTDDTHVAVWYVTRYKTPNKIFLADLVGETLRFDQDPNLVTLQKVALEYKDGSTKSLLKAFNEIPKSSYDLFATYYTTDELTSFLYQIPNKNEDFDLLVNTSNVVDLNNIGYFLEQANALEPARFMLEKVLRAYPEREVAYLNLGDVFYKMKDLNQASSNYKEYIRLMNKRNLSQKIPSRIVDFLNNQK